MISPKVSISKALCMALSSRRSGGKGCCGNNPGHHAGVGELNQNLSRKRQRKGPDCCTLAVGKLSVGGRILKSLGRKQSIDSDGKVNKWIWPTFPVLPYPFSFVFTLDNRIALNSNRHLMSTNYERGTE